MRGPCVSLSPALSTHHAHIDSAEKPFGTSGWSSKEQPCWPVFTNCLQELPPLASRSSSSWRIFQPQSHVTPFRKASLTILSFRSCWACAADTRYSHFQFPLPHLPRAALWLLSLPRGFLAGKGRRVRPRGADVTPDFSTLPKATSSSQGGPFKPGHGGLQPVLTTDAAFCVLPPFLAHATANSPAVKLSDYPGWSVLPVFCRDPDWHRCPS